MSDWANSTCVAISPSNPGVYWRSSPHAENSERPSEEQENIPIAGEEPQAPVSTKNVKKTARKTKGKGNGLMHLLYALQMSFRFAI